MTTKFKQPSLPTYRTKLPSTGKEISFRPFTVAEEKLLIIAKADDADSREASIEDATLAAVQNCILSGQSVDTLSSIDIEWLILQLRIKSIGENVDVYFNCLKTYDGKKCNGKMETTVYLNEVQVEGLTKDKMQPLALDFDGVTYTIEFNPMTFSVTKQVKQLIEKNSDFVNDFDVLVLYTMIDKIYTVDEMWTKETLSPEEFKQFVSVMTPKQKKQIADYFKNPPHLHYDIDLQCPICGNQSKYELRTLNDFF